MVRIDYDVIFHALRLRSPAAIAGKSYAVRFTRRGVDCLSHVERCLATGEVVFAELSDPVTQAPCPVMFTEIKERRTVDVELYDFTVQKRPEKIGSSSFDLIDVCDVTTKQKARKRIELRFRVAGKETLLEFIVIMTPAGQTPLERGAAPQQPAAPVTRIQQPRASSHEPPKQVLSPAVCAFLVKRGLVGTAGEDDPTRPIEVVVDDDIAHEITARASQLMSRPQEQQLASQARIRQRDELAAEVRALEEALTAQVPAATGQAKNTKAGDSLDMDQLLQQELVHWHQTVANWEAARDRAQKARDAAYAASQRLDESSTSQLQPGSIVAELEAQRAVLQDELHELEAEQSRRDVTNEACQILEQISHLSSIIEDAQREETANRQQGTGSTELSRSERDELLRLAQLLLAWEVTLERNQYALSVAESILRNPPSRDGPMPPEVLKCMSAGPLFSQHGVVDGGKPAANEASKQLAAPVEKKKDTKDFMMDFFSDVGGPSSSSAASGPGGNATAAPADSLFSTPTQVVVAESAPKRSAQFVPFIPTPSALPDIRCGVSPAEIDFGDKSLIGFQVNIVNDGHLTLTLENTAVVVEDLFSANEVTVDGIIYPKKLVVGPNSNSMLYFGAFNQALLVCRGTMSLAMKATATSSDATRPNNSSTEPRVFSIRLPSH